MMSRGSIAVGVGVADTLELQATRIMISAEKNQNLPTTDLLLEQ
jgi:hypothetical protein